MISLSCDINMFLKNIEYLKLYNIQQTEIVITRYDEDLTWTEGFRHICTVYNKGPIPIPNKDEFARVFNVPNYGINEEVVLRHIIENYNSLATITFFAQGRILDRSDQPLFPLLYYLENPKGTAIRGYYYNSYCPPSWKYNGRCSTPECEAIKGRTLAQFREEIIGIPYRQWEELWAAGDWISVGCDLIRRRSLEFYKSIYNACEFQRGVCVEEVSFLERSFYTIWTS